MTGTGRLRVRKRPLAEQERADLERQARESERFFLHHWGQAVKRWTLLGCGVAALLAMLWGATVQWNLSRPRSAIAAAVIGIGFLAIAGFELYEARARVTAGRTRWAHTLEQASSRPVVEIEVKPERVWGSPEDGWMFDVGEGRGLFADWDLPFGAPTDSLVASVSAAGGVWFDQAGPELDYEPLPYSWEDLRDDHPLLEFVGPVTFRLEGDAGAALRDFFEAEWLVPPEPRNEE